MNEKWKLAMKIYPHIHVRSDCEWMKKQRLVLRLDSHVRADLQMNEWKVGIWQFRLSCKSRLQMNEWKVEIGV